MKNEPIENKDIIVDASDVMFAYKTDDLVELEDVKPVLNDLSVKIRKGSYTAILGPNGSGKSTFAKLINVLEQPDKGSILVFGIDTKNEERFWDIREHCSYVFQNPDNQIVGTIVEEDVAFGPENLGIPNPELRERVDAALSYVGLKEFSKKQAAHLSGGQKQKLAIAGALAMKPEILILDESTAMLDPDSREEFLTIVERMNREEGLTVITITHDMYEASRTEEIYVIESGKISMHGTPAEIFSRVEDVRKAGLDVPEFIDVFDNICKVTGIAPSSEELQNEDTVIEGIKRRIRDFDFSNFDTTSETESCEKHSRKILEVKNLSYSYDKNGRYAIEDISFDVKEGEIFAIVGRSGCGKTTLITHLNGIMRPQVGEVTIFPDENTTLSTTNKKEILKIRQNVGLVFQYPEYQLFEESVFKDISYGLRKMKLTEDEKKERVLKATRRVHLDEEKLEVSPFDLSGGQKRRAAIAGVIAMEPKILVLDEPASGLDPRGRAEMFRMINELRASGTTIILVSHNMDEAARYADRILAIKEGHKAALMNPSDLFSSAEHAKSVGLQLPRLFAFAEKLKNELKKEYPEAEFKPSKANPKAEALSILEALREVSHA